MDHYATLGLTYSADAHAIKEAYRSLAKRYHPDVSKEVNAQEQFIRVTQAYEILSDPIKRSRY
ncbi:MAG TPA: DnaJ domain-containing protein, partial [Flavobacteriales bacterium]|nr:DnaJ domain-containing protein [Flavobacteriales bacterium]